MDVTLVENIQGQHRPYIDRPIIQNISSVSSSGDASKTLLFFIVIHFQRLM